MGPREVARPDDRLQRGIPYSRRLLSNSGFGDYWIIRLRG